MGKILSVISGKGGVGKSTFSVALGNAFCKRGKKVLLIDMDEGLRCLDLMLGIDRTAIFDLADVLSGKEIEDAIYQSAEMEGLSLIPAPARPDSVSGETLAQFAKRVEKMFDVVIFDFPAGINMELYTALPPETQFLAVAVPDPVSVRDASSIGLRLAEKGIKARLVINRYVYKQSIRFKHKNVDEMIDGAGIRLIGIVPESYELANLSLKHKLSRRSKATAAVLRIAARLEDERVPLPRLKKI